MTRSSKLCTELSVRYGLNSAPGTNKTPTDQQATTRQFPASIYSSSTTPTLHTSRCTRKKRSQSCTADLIKENERLFRVACDHKRQTRLSVNCAAHLSTPPAMQRHTRDCMMMVSGLSARRAAAFTLDRRLVGIVVFVRVLGLTSRKLLLVCHCRSF